MREHHHRGLTQPVMPEGGAASEWHANPNELGLTAATHDPVSRRSPMAQPHHDNTAGPASAAGAGEAIQTIRALVEARDIRTAKQQLRRTQTHLDDPTWAMIGEIANTLRYKTHDVAITKLRKLWRDNEQHRALIEACVPKTDQHQYIPDTRPAATRRTDPAWRRPGLVARRVEETKRTDPRQRTGSGGASRVDAYEDQLTTEERREPGTPRPELIVDRRDYDRDAAAKVTDPLCVSCRLERACIDRWTGQITTGHGDDGLCGTCREEGRPGIPELPLEHTRSQAIQVRLDTIAANFDSHSPELFRQEWRYGDRLTKAVTEDWVRQHNRRVVARATPTKSVDLNGECGGCREWRQLRDELCVDCHEGLNGEVVIAGTLEPLTIKGPLARIVNDDATLQTPTHPPADTAAANNAWDRTVFMQRLKTGPTSEDSMTASPQDHSKTVAIGDDQLHEPTAPRTKSADQTRTRFNTSTPNLKQRNQKPAMATSNDPKTAISEPAKDPAVRRRQQLRKRATVATASHRRRI
ncbi:hypothetical protein OG203_11165 [Nocardia sp. NBC_01499]|uniref:hypothetical protein n=1 Tax=Nocardia sp. NBC_01499 TaxID=2903597 RepID=UPI003863D37E